MEISKLHIYVFSLFLIGMFFGVQKGNAQEETFNETFTYEEFLGV